MGHRGLEVVGVNGGVEGEVEGEEGMDSRTPSVVRRRKRGARKGKGHQQQAQQQYLASAPTTALPPVPVDALETLATGTQALAREISRTSRSQSSASHRATGVGGTATPTSTSSVPPLPTQAPLPLSLAASITPLSAQLLRSAKTNAFSANTHPHGRGYPHSHGHGHMHMYTHGRSDVPKHTINGGAFDWENNSNKSSTVYHGNGLGSSSSVRVGSSLASASSLELSAAATMSSYGMEEVCEDGSGSGSGSRTGSLSALPPVDAAAATETKPVPLQKKTSKWKLSFGRSSSNNTSRPAVTAVLADPGSTTNGSASDQTVHKQQQQHLQPQHHQHQQRGVSPVASNVTSVVMGLDAPSRKGMNTPSPRAKGSLQANGDVSSTSVSPPGRSMGSGDHWRGRQQRAQGGTSADATWGGPRYEKRAHNDRNPSPTSSRNGRYSVSSASSIANSSVSSNWRNSSLSTASSASSAFTRYSNASVRSVSTTATSVSGGSWRNQSTTSLSSVGNGKPGSVQVSSGSSVSSVRSDASKVPPPNVKSE